MPRLIRLSQVYRMIPLHERLCEGCSNPIERNAALLDGVLYHFGCMKRLNIHPTHMCLSCGSFLTPRKITVSWIDGEKMQTCGLCGNQDLTPLGRPKWQPKPPTFPHEALPGDHDPFREPWDGGGRSW